MRSRRLLLRKGLLGGAGNEAVLIDRTAGSAIGNATGGGGLAAAFDGNTNQAAAACAQRASATSAFVGRTLAAAKIAHSAVVYGANDGGIINGSNPEVTLKLWGKDGAAPSSGTDGTELGTLTFTDTADNTARTILSTDLVNTWDHLWVNGTIGAGANWRIAELELYEWA